MKKIVSAVCILICPLLMGLTTLVDPTRPPNFGEAPKTTTAGQSLVLTGVFLYPNKKIAIINEQEATIGDRIGDYTITDITVDGVELLGSKQNTEMIYIVTPVKKLTPLAP